MHRLKVITVGNSSAVVLPKEVLARLKVEKGDTVYLVETEDGYELTPYDAEFDQQMEAAEQGLRQYRNALRELSRK